MPYNLKKQLCTTGKYYTGRSGNKVENITLHHFAGTATPEAQILDWQKSNRNVSANYLLKDKNVLEYVEEKNAPWTNGGNSNYKTISIEISNFKLAPNYEISDDSLQTTIELCADIALRNKLYPLKVGETLKAHYMVAPTACPGAYVKSKMQYIADEANKIIENKSGLNKKTYSVKVPHVASYQECESIKIWIQREALYNVIIEEE